MAHAEQVEFCSFVSEKYPEHFINKDVLDVGSYDVNGNNRYLFTNCLYLGVDVAAGKNVDIVQVFHTFNPKKQFDTIISTEMLEHDKYWELSLRHMVELLKPKGFLLFSCAYPGRAEHGTLNVNEPNQGNGQQQFDEEWKNYYKNIGIEDIRKAIDCDKEFSTYNFFVNNNCFDLYFYGVKR